MSDAAKVYAKAKELFELEKLNSPHLRDCVFDDGLTKRESLGARTTIHLTNEQRAPYLDRAKTMLGGGDTHTSDR